jgi:hypothetical protein
MYEEEDTYHELAPLHQTRLEASREVLNNIPWHLNTYKDTCVPMSATPRRPPGERRAAQQLLRHSDTFEDTGVPMLATPRKT